MCLALSVAYGTAEALLVPSGDAEWVSVIEFKEMSCNTDDGRFEWMY